MNKTSGHIAYAALALLLSAAAAWGQHYTQTNLVANTPGVGFVTDANLVNAWGLARSTLSPWWVADQAKGVSTLYDGSGNKLALTVTIPPAVPGHPGLPSGVIFNGSTTDFVLPDGKAANFIFATLDGTIAAWNSGLGKTAMTVVRTTNNSVYTGLTSAVVKGHRYLYVANFNTGQVDVYNSTFHRVSFEHEGEASGQDGDDDRNDEGESESAFTDRRLPGDYVPFNVQAIGNDIVVTYALHEEGQRLETDGPGLGYVDIFTASGRLITRLQHGDWLNAPWGVALAPLDFGWFSHSLLVAQFAGGGTTESSGYIAAYDMASGKFKGLLLEASGKPLAINGIWAISFGNAATASSFDSARSPGGAAAMYFTAGPNMQSAGLFGFVSPMITELVQGNDQ